MIRNETQHVKTTVKCSTSESKAQQVIDLKRRILDVREALLDLGGDTDYMPFFIAQAMREGVKLGTAERKRLGQIMNGRVFSGDAERVEFIERSIKALQPAA